MFHPRGSPATTGRVKGPVRSAACTGPGAHPCEAVAPGGGGPLAAPGARTCTRAVAAHRLHGHPSPRAVQPPNFRLRPRSGLLTSDWLDLPRSHASISPQ
ncbi:hypothetical protein NN561_020383 [Cricetulus griseus]